MSTLDPKDIKAGPLPDVDTLEIVAAKRADLTARISWAKLQHELVGLSPEAIIALADEVGDFKRTVRALKGLFDEETAT